MRKLFALLVIFVMSIAACGGGQENTAAPKRSVPAPDQNVPQDLGDPTQPVQVRAYQKAKEVKKEIEARRQQEQPALDARD